MSHRHSSTPRGDRPENSLEESTAIELEARETAWEIAPGHTVRGWGFNGMIPGPTIEARVGDAVSIRLVNRLPEATTIHWHGLRIPAAMDGTELVQRAVEPGETFEYRFRLPDAGTFWYHPHQNEPVQMERGLYGALIVREDDGITVDGERVLVLDDLRLNWRGRIARFGSILQRHDGREGNVRLINGTSEPELTMAAGQVERWRIVNASSARYIRLSIGNLPFRILGTDGGLLSEPVSASEVLLTPSDRVDLAVGPFDENQVLPIESLAYNRGAFGKPRTERFGTLRVGPKEPSIARIPNVLRAIEPLVTEPVQPTREVRLDGRVSFRRGVDYLIDGERHHHGEPVRVGELQVWDVINETPLDHPFHLHGFFFQVLDINGAPPPFLSWEDNVNVPANGHIRIAWMPDDRPGSWMYHCHILEHAAAGMMAHFDVVR